MRTTVPLKPRVHIPILRRQPVMHLLAPPPALEGSGGEFSCIGAFRVSHVPQLPTVTALYLGITFLSLRLFLRVSRSPVSVCRHSESPAGGTGARERGGVWLPQMMSLCLVAQRPT